MWPLRDFRFDEGIDAGEVYVSLEAGEPGELLPRDEAIALAHRRGLNLVAWWPEGGEEGPPSCFLGKVTLPLRWERAEPGPDVIDGRLWFEASCGGRDYLVEAGGHTFPGRMLAWCAERGREYLVSLDEMGAMSDEARYFVRGYLAGNEPGPPEETDEGVAPHDQEAWLAATARFRRTGRWYGRWATCRECGCVLLPDAGGDRCAEHADASTDQ